jgi:polygalacturonase
MSIEEFDVTSYGADPTGKRRSTDMIQDALDDCAETGGKVMIPQGTYRTGPLVVGDDTTIDIAGGATVQFVADLTAFPTARSRWEGWEQHGFHPCLLVSGASNVVLQGNGIVDGGGEYWWQFAESDPSTYPDGLTERLETFAERNERDLDNMSPLCRPPLVQVRESDRVRLSGLRFRNSPFWCLHVLYSDNVSIIDISVENPPDAPNGDGLDVDSSRFVRVSDSYFDAGDDAICIKSGKDEEGREVGRPSENITVTNCTVEHGHGGVVVGSETAGDVRNVTVSNCTFTDTDRGIRIKSRRGRGGTVENLRFSNLVFEHVVCPFVVNLFYYTDVDTDHQPVTDATPTVRDVHLSDITAHDVASAAFIGGLPERSLEGISLRNVDIEATADFTDFDVATGTAMARGYEEGPEMWGRYVDDLDIQNLTVRTRSGGGLELESIRALDLVGVTHQDADEEQPSIRLTDVENAFVDRCRRIPAAGTTIAIAGDDTQDIRLSASASEVKVDSAVRDGVQRDG